MKKVSILCMSMAMLCAATCSVSNVRAQALPLLATQSVKMKLGKVINLGFINGTGEMVSLFFSDPKTLSAGKESPVQNFVVRTNEIFNVSVSSVSTTFSYRNHAGGNHKAVVPVAGIIKVKVDNNKTGGTSAGKYHDLTNTPIQLITDGKTGDGQSFSVQFKATPGTEMPEGVYEVAVMYTASPM